MEHHDCSPESPRPNRRQFLSTTGSTVAAGVIGHRGRLINQSSSPQPYKKEGKMKGTNPSIVFCHGIWADGSCFSKVMPPLEAEGYEVVSAQYGLNSNVEDVAAAVRYFGHVSNPILLVGHSYGGAVITAAGTDDRVAGLVYIAALGPDETETSQGEQEKLPRTPLFSHIEIADGRIWMLPDGVECFAGDLSEQEKKIVWATHFAPAASLFTQKLDGVAWRSKPSSYIVAT